MLTKKKIIEQQKALIADLREEIEHKERLINFQHDRILKLQEENSALKTINKVTDIDFPNSRKEELSHIYGINSIGDILNL